MPGNADKHAPVLSILCCACRIHGMQGGLSLACFRLGCREFRRHPSHRRLSRGLLKFRDFGKLLRIRSAGPGPPRSGGPSIRNAGLVIVPQHAPAGPDPAIGALTPLRRRNRDPATGSRGGVEQGTGNPASHCRFSAPIGTLKVPVLGRHSRPLLDTSPAIGCWL